MVLLKTSSPQFAGGLCDEIRLFINGEKIAKTENIPPEFKGFAIEHILKKTDGNYISAAFLYKDSDKVSSHAETLPAVENAGDLISKKLQKRVSKLSVYYALKKHFKTRLPWGALTGIRPSKLARELISEYGSEKKAKEAFINLFNVSSGKTALAFEIAHNQKNILENVHENEADIYIGIPFCASRCHYCSFASNDINKYGDFVDIYLDKLIREMQFVLGRLKPKVRAAYIGGGTPTALDIKRLERLLSACDAYFKNVREYTLEAGRPDTITKEKLDIIKSFNISRISVNPQTLNDNTLIRIGRNHTAKDFTEKFEMARKAGFDRINTDIIAGLPGETLKDVRNTLKGILRLSPENVTVHTLAIKRASKLKYSNETYVSMDKARKMTDECLEKLKQKGYIPYYMYRQKYMLGNLENTGYAKPRCECLYNIDNMEETASIIAFGAGAISKKVTPVKNLIERTANVSDLKNYIERTEEMAIRKIELFLDK